MASHLPPVPPAGRSNKGPGESGKATESGGQAPGRDINTAEQGDPGNTKQNTTNTGLQQDR